MMVLEVREPADVYADVARWRKGRLKAVVVQIRAIPLI